jgi:hypothetical protein
MKETSKLFSLEGMSGLYLALRDHSPIYFEGLQVLMACQMVRTKRCVQTKRGVRSDRIRKSKMVGRRPNAHENTVGYVMKETRN